MIKNNDKVGQEQLYDLLVSRELSWQSIILDLIRTEQLDPWDIDLSILAKKYVERIQQIQEQEHVFFISSKVLLAAAILLRIKSELLHENILSIDEILFDKKKKSGVEISEMKPLVDFAEDEMPEILPRTPLARGRKVTLQELIKALDKAINTEHRRIKKEIKMRRIQQDISFVLPKKTIDIRQKIKELYLKIKTFFSKKKPEEILTFTGLVGTSRDERIACFLPLLHLDTQEKIVLEQPSPFDEINILLYAESKIKQEIEGQESESEEHESKGLVDEEKSLAPK